MKHIIWSSMTDPENWKNCLDPNMTDEQNHDAIRQMNCSILTDERKNLDIQLDQPIIVIADLGLWSGRRSGYKEIVSGNIKDCLYSDCDDIEWYVDSHRNLRADAYHHDGTNHYLYRVWKPDLSDEAKSMFLYKILKGTFTSRDISRYTSAIGSRIADVYGWTFHQKKYRPKFGEIARIEGDASSIGLEDYNVRVSSYVQLLETPRKHAKKVFVRIFNIDGDTDVNARINIRSIMPR